MRRRKFRVPYEGEEQKISARRYVQLAWPEGAHSQVDALFEAGRVEADGILVTRPDRPLAAGTTVVCEIDDEGERTYGVPEVDALLRGDQWVVVDKPAGIPGTMRDEDPTDPIRFMADVLGLDRDGVRPVWQIPAGAAGPWLLALDEATAKSLGDAVAAGRIQTSWQAIVARPERPRGRWSGPGGVVDFAITRTRGELAEVQLQPKWKGLDDPRRLFFHLMGMLAEAGFAVLGDTVDGGYLVPGDLRLRLGAMYGTDEFADSWPAPRQWWPEEPVIRPVVVPEQMPEGAPKAEVGQLEVPKRVLDVWMEGSHPWVMHDPAMDVEALLPGRRAQLVGPDGPEDAYVLIDGTGPVAARRWSTVRDQAQDFAGEVAIRLDEAIGRRRRYFRQMGTTNVFRIVHGEADGLPGLVIDRLGSVLRVALVGRCARAYGDIVYDRLEELEPEATILEVVAHRQDVEKPGIRIVRSGERKEISTTSLIVREDGLGYRVDPRRPFAVEFSADHRDNRRRTVDKAQPGQRWLVAVPDGGSFAVALANAGVETTVIHESDKETERLDEQFAINGLSTKLREQVVETLFAYLERTEHTFDGIVVEVPSSANVAEVGSFETLLERCSAVLDSGGWILFARRGGGDGASVAERVEHWAKRMAHAVDVVEKAPPAGDFPHLEGFGEGDSFEGLWMQISQ